MTLAVVDNIGTQSVGGHTVPLSSMARIPYITAATSVDVTTYSNSYTGNNAPFGFPDQSSIAIWINGVWFATIQSTAQAVDEVTTVALPAGTKQVDFVMGGTAIGSPKTGTWVVDVAFNASATPLVPTYNSRMVAYTDSIGTGCNAAPPVRLGWLMQMRAAHPNLSLVLTGFGGGRLLDNQGDNYAAFVASVAAVQPDIFYSAIGVNDGWASTSTATFQAAYETMLDALRAVCPNTRAYLQSPLYTTVFDATAYRAAIATVAAARSSWCTYIDGLPLVDPSHILTDVYHVHPDTAGHTQYFGNVDALLNYAPSPRLRRRNLML